MMIFNLPVRFHGFSWKWNFSSHKSKGVQAEACDWLMTFEERCLSWQAIVLPAYLHLQSCSSSPFLLPHSPCQYPVTSISAELTEHPSLWSTYTAYWGSLLSQHQEAVQMDNGVFKAGPWHGKGFVPKLFLTIKVSSVQKLFRKNRKISPRKSKVLHVFCSSLVI